jgi:tetratricopeptide (TPR) repeat protein
MEGRAIPNPISFQVFTQAKSLCFQARRAKTNMVQAGQTASRSESSDSSRWRHGGDLLRQKRVPEGLVFSFLAITVFVIYSNTLQSPFVFDDVRNILNNPHIRLTERPWESIIEAGLEGPTDRPVAKISFALNYYFHRYEVAGYHLVNMAIHLAAGIFLYLFIKTTLSLPACGFRQRPKEWIPFFAALIWLVHPLHTQSVSYTVQRMTSMAAMFYILSMLLYAKGRLTEHEGKRWALMAGSILSGLLALGSKEIAATLPIFIFLYEWYFFQDLDRAWLKRHGLLLAALFVFLLVTILIYLGPKPWKAILSGYEDRDFTLAQRVLTEFRVVIFYLGLLLYPHPSRLNLDHDFPLSHGLLEPVATLFAIAAIAGLLGLALFMAERERLISFFILWFLGNLVIESSVIPLAIIFEHRTYLPSMFAGLAGVITAYRYLKGPRVTVVVLSAVVVLFAFWTYERNKVWQDKITLWEDCAKKAPNNARPHNNLAVALAERGLLNEAISHYYESLRIIPEQAETHYSLGLALARQGRLDQAITHYGEALRIDPNQASVRCSLGMALAAQERLEEAIGHYSKAVQIEPDNADAHKKMGVALAKQGRLEEAIAHFSEALRIRPHDGEARFSLTRAKILLRETTRRWDTLPEK